MKIILHPMPASESALFMPVIQPIKASGNVQLQGNQPPSLVFHLCIVHRHEWHDSKIDQNFSHKNALKFKTCSSIATHVRQRILFEFNIKLADQHTNTLLDCLWRNKIQRICRISNKTRTNVDALAVMNIIVRISPHSALIITRVLRPKFALRL